MTSRSFLPAASSTLSPYPSRPRTAALALPRDTRPVLRLALLFTLALAALFLLRSSAHAQDWPPDQPDPQSGYGNDQPQNPQYASNAPNYNQPYANGYGQQLSQQPPLSAGQLSQLVAPIALYPDALVAQILAASTYPAQITAADQWLQSMRGASPEQIAAGANAQAAWDPSVKALTAFPQVLSMLDSNLSWTSALGNAYYNQPQDVMQTIQVLRDRAQQAGTLQSTQQQAVTDDDGYIGIEPVNPEVVYVPTYDPWAVYGVPIEPYPGYAYYGGYYGASIYWGRGFYVNAFYNQPWGWGGWGLDWYGCSILYHRDYWYTRSSSVRDWGYRYGGPRWRGHDGYRGGDRGYGRGGDYGRNGNDRGYGRDGNRGGDYGHNGGYGGRGNQGGPGYGNGGGRNNGGYGNGGDRSHNGNGPAFGNGGNNSASRGQDARLRSNPIARGPYQSYNGDSRNGSNNNYGSGVRSPFNGAPSAPGSGWNRTPGGTGPQQGYQSPRQTFNGNGSAYGSYGYNGNTRNVYTPRAGNGSVYSAPSRSPMQSYSGAYGGNRGYSAPSSNLARPQNYGGYAGSAGSYGGGRSYSAPSYQAPRSYGGGNFRAPQQSRSFNGGGSYSGGNNRSFSGGGSYSGGGNHSFSSGGGSHGFSGGSSGGGNHGGGGGGGHHR